MNGELADGHGDAHHPETHHPFAVLRFITLALKCMQKFRLEKQQLRLLA